MLRLRRAVSSAHTTGCRLLSSKSNKKGSAFRPSKSSPSRPSSAPLSKKKKQTDWSPGNPHKFVDLLDTKRSAADALSATYGPLAADILREQQANKAPLSVGDELDEQLRWADYLLAEQGSTEDLVGERRALSQLHNRDDFLDDLHSAISAERINNLDLNETDFAPKPLKRASAMAQWVDEDDTDRAGGGDDDDPETVLDKNQLAHGDWSEMLVKVDRNIKLWRGGRLESYRALIVGGNMNGCGGFGFGKSTDPLRAVDLASRHCKRNIFFVDRYQNNGITRDLAGKQNSCVVTIRATDNGLRGNALVSEILKRFGIVNAVAKSHGNRNPYNVVRATFKALMTHESLEDIALKRGKRLVSVDRARRMQV